MRKILIYLSFVIASAVIVVLFVTSTTYTQLAVASLLYPPLAYFAFALFPRKIRKAAEMEKSAAVEIQPVLPAPTEIAERGTVDIVDIDKRAFLKLIGAAGLSLFLFSIFSKRAEALFFGRAGVTALEDPEGNKIYPAERQVTDGYQISEVDDGFIAFYGFINKQGGWYIIKDDQDAGSIRYTKGEANFPGNWANRERLPYDYFHNVFS